MPLPRRRVGGSGRFRACRSCCSTIRDPCRADHAEPARAHERDGVRRDGALPPDARCRQPRQRRARAGRHRRRSRLLLGRRPDRLRRAAQHRGAHGADDRAAGDGAARRHRVDVAAHAPTGDRRDQRCCRRRRAVPRNGVRRPRRVGRGVLPGRGDQQRAHGERDGAELPAAACDRRVPRVRDHAHGSRRRRRGGRADRFGVERRAGRRAARPLLLDRRARHRAQPPGRGAHQAEPLGEPRRRQPVAAHEPGRCAAALRPHAHRQLRGSHARAAREARTGLPRTRADPNGGDHGRAPARTATRDVPAHVRRRRSRRLGRRPRPGRALQTRRASTSWSSRTTWCSARTSRRTAARSSAAARAASSRPGPTVTGSSRSPRWPSSAA